MTVRDHRIDNAKGVLIILVVLGHLVWPVPSGGKGADSLYYFVYFVHMPMFALISGYLSRVETGRAALNRNGRLLLAPYAIFMVLQVLVLQLLGGPSYPVLEGHFGLWYLLSLFCWRMLLPYVRRIPLVLPLSVALALAAGFVPFIGLPLSLSRTLVLLPFFLAGHLLREQGKAPTEVYSRFVAAVAVAFGLMLAAFLSGYNYQPMLYGNGPYAALSPKLAVGFAARVIQLAIAFGLGLAELALTPGGESPLTRIGRNSLTVYLLHPLLLVPSRLWPGAHAVLGSNGWLQVPAALLLCWLLASPPVVRATRRLVAPFPPASR